MSERNLAGTLRTLFPGITVRVENSAGVGTPDVNYMLPGNRCGWIELKEATLGKDGRLRFHRFTAQQVLFLRAWCAQGGKAWLLVRVVDKGIFLISGEHYELLARCRNGKATLNDLKFAKTWYGAFLNEYSMKELAEVL